MGDMIKLKFLKSYKIGPKNIRFSYFQNICTMKGQTADNSGALEVQIIGNIKRRANKNPTIGSICTLSVKEIINSNDTKVKKKQILKGVLATRKRSLEDVMEHMFVFTKIDLFWLTT